MPDRRRGGPTVTAAGGLVAAALLLPVLVLLLAPLLLALLLLMMWPLLKLLLLVLVLPTPPSLPLKRCKTKKWNNKRTPSSSSTCAAMCSKGCLHIGQNSSTQLFAHRNVAAAGCVVQSDVSRYIIRRTDAAQVCGKTFHHTVSFSSAGCADLGVCAGRHWHDCHNIRNFCHWVDGGHWVLLWYSDHSNRG